MSDPPDGDVSRTCPGRVPDVSRTCPGRVLDVSWTCLGHVLGWRRLLSPQRADASTHLRRNLGYSSRYSPRPTSPLHPPLSRAVPRARATPRAPREQPPGSLRLLGRRGLPTPPPPPPLRGRAAAAAPPRLWPKRRARDRLPSGRRPGWRWRRRGRGGGAAATAWRTPQRSAAWPRRKRNGWPSQRTCDGGASASRLSALGASEVGWQSRVISCDLVSCDLV